MTEGVDYSYDRPSLSAIKAAGRAFVVRYGAMGNPSKWLTAPEAASLRAAGLDIVANVEETARAFTGAAAGDRHARAGDAFFKGLGMPGDRPIYFSVDWDAGPADWPGIDAAVQAAADFLGAGRVGVYGSYATIEHVRSVGVASWFWQTYAWSGGKWSAAAQLQQYKNSQTLGGGAVDFDRSTVADYGQWGRGMATSQNGWPVATADDVDNGLYQGVKFPNGALAGDVAFVFRWLILQLHTRVESIRGGTCWGWYVKTISGSNTTTLSNHASGTAMDYNASNHPQGARNTYSTAQQNEIHAILDEADGVFRWGGDYTGTPDDMHFEIIKNAAAVKALRAKLEDDVSEQDVTNALTKFFARTGDSTSGTLSSRIGQDAGNQSVPNPFSATGTKTPAWQMWQNTGQSTIRLEKAVAALQQAVAALQSAPPVPVTVDVTALAAAINAQVAAAVADEIQRRMQA